MKLHTLETLALTSSNVTGSTYDEWVDDNSTGYSIGDNVKVSFLADGVTAKFPVLEYTSLADTNLDNYPADNPADWIELGAENRCKMFDDYTNTQTVNSDDIEIVISANGVASVGIFGIYGTSVNLKLIRNAVTIKEETIDLRSIVPVSGWYSWLYNKYEYGITQIIWEFPRYITGATLEITISKIISTAKCGLVVVGNAVELGASQYGVKIGIDDYSIKDTDSLGRTYLSQGSYAKRADVSMDINNANIDFVTQKLTAVRGIPAMFDLNNDETAYQDYYTHQALALYGYPQNFDITIPGPVKSKCNLEVKGLI